MDRCLPYEILVLISCLVDKDDVSNLRLVSKAMASAGLEALPGYQHFYFRKRSMERLRFFAEHPVLCSRLYMITFIADVVPKFENSGVWEAQAQAVRQVSTTLIKNAAVAPVPVKDLEESFRELGWDHQQKLRAEQETLLGDLQTTFEALRRSLGKLNNLRTFLLRTLSRHYDQAMRPLFMLEAGQSWYCSNVTCSLESFETVSVRIFNALLTSRCSLSFKSSTLPLVHLEIGATDFVNFTRKTLPMLWTQPDILKNLTIVQFASYGKGRLRPIENHPEVANFQDMSFFCQLLAHSPKLLDLGISVRVESHFNLDTIFHGRNWSSLTYLDLYNVEGSLSMFQVFLSSHAKSITYIRLWDTNLRAGALPERVWIELLKHIKTNLQLTEIHLDGILTERNYVRFNSKAAVALNPEISINVDDIVHFLICGQKPDGLADDQLLQTLTWTDLLPAYDEQ